MQEKHLFEYAVIRLVPRVEREEFLNVGVILFCASRKFLDCIYELDEQRLHCFTGSVDLTEIKERLEAFKNICKGKHEGGTIGKLPTPSRFRWLTAMRSTVVQTSAVHPGFCEDPAETLLRLHRRLVCFNHEDQEK